MKINVSVPAPNWFHGNAFLAYNILLMFANLSRISTRSLGSSGPWPTKEKTLPTSKSLRIKTVAVGPHVPTITVLSWARVILLWIWEAVAPLWVYHWGWIYSRLIVTTYLISFHCLRVNVYSPVL
jgi:hypothetical protein